jgi:hypothetical protein
MRLDSAKCFQISECFNRGNQAHILLPHFVSPRQEFRIYRSVNSPNPCCSTSLKWSGFYLIVCRMIQRIVDEMLSCVSLCASSHKFCRSNDAASSQAVQNLHMCKPFPCPTREPRFIPQSRVAAAPSAGYLIGAAMPSSMTHDSCLSSD